MLEEIEVPKPPKAPTCPICLVSFKSTEELKAHMIRKVEKLQAALEKLK
jgi:hypothetical protein